MKKRLVSILMTGVMAAGLMACGNTTTEAPAESAFTEAAAAEETTAEAASTEAAADAASTEVESAETKELSGEVTVYMPSPKGLNTAYIEGFEAATGVKVNLFEGTTGEILARLEAEKDNPVADVVVLASWSDGLSYAADNELVSYPEAENVDLLYSDWVNKDYTLFGTSASAVGVIYNTTLIDSLDADWADLASDEYKDLVAIPDPQKSGSCKDFLAGYMNATNEDWSAFEGMAANGLTNGGANKAALESVLTGEKAILVAGVDYNGYSNADKGEPVAIYYPASGTVINPRPAMILGSTQNLDNAKAFIDYLMSDEAQQAVADAYLLPGRTDVQCTNRTNVADIPQLDTDWDWMMEHADDIAQTLADMIQ